MLIFSDPVNSDGGGAAPLPLLPVRHGDVRAAGGPRGARAGARRRPGGATAARARRRPRGGARGVERPAALRLPQGVRTLQVCGGGWRAVAGQEKVFC